MPSKILKGSCVQGGGSQKMATESLPVWLGVSEGSWRGIALSKYLIVDVVSGGPQVATGRGRVLRLGEIFFHIPVLWPVQKKHPSKSGSGVLLLLFSQSHLQFHSGKMLCHP